MFEISKMIGRIEGTAMDQNDVQSLIQIMICATANYIIKNPECATRTMLSGEEFKAKISALMNKKPVTVSETYFG